MKKQWQRVLSIVVVLQYNAALKLCSKYLPRRSQIVIDLYSPCIHSRHSLKTLFNYSPPGRLLTRVKTSLFSFDPQEVGRFSVYCCIAIIIIPGGDETIHAVLMMDDGTFSNLSYIVYSFLSVISCTWKILNLAFLLKDLAFHIFLLFLERISPVLFGKEGFKCMLLGHGYVKERLKSSLMKFYGKEILSNNMSPPPSQILHDILKDDPMQWHPPLIRHTWSNFWPCYW